MRLYSKLGWFGQAVKAAKSEINHDRMFL